MAKKYYWLKLQNDFFSQTVIKKLRKIAGGDTYTIIYLKLQLLSLKDEGKLFYEGIEDDFVKEIALTLDEEEENVKVTLLFLKQYGLIEEVAQDQFLLPETIKNIGSETQGAERVRRFRQKQKGNPKVLPCNAPVTNGNTEKRREELELELEKKKELKLDTEQDIKTEKIPWKRILIAWNDLPNPIKPIRSVTPNRQDKIKARMNSNNCKATLEDILQAIENIKSSDFCQGKGNKNWVIDFDWMFYSDDHFNKVLEGKYANKEVSKESNEQSKHKEGLDESGIGFHF